MHVHGCAAGRGDRRHAKLTQQVVRASAARKPGCAFSHAQLADLLDHHSEAPLCLLPASFNHSYPGIAVHTCSKEGHSSLRLPPKLRLRVVTAAGEHACRHV